MNGEYSSRWPWIVSVAFNWHDSSVAIARGPQVHLVLEAERIFRVKKCRCDAQQMNDLVMLALKEVNITPDDVGIWCGTAFGNRWFAEDAVAHKDLEWRNLNILGRSVSFRCVSHHRAHAAMFFASPYSQAVVISCDGGGDNETHVSFLGRGLELQRLEPTATMSVFSSVFYDRASFYVYGQFRQEGKFMGLAGWGEPNEALREELTGQMAVICNLKEEEGVDLLRQIYPLPSFDPGDRRTRTFAATVQLVYEDFRVTTAREHRKFDSNLVLVGGSGLNVLANHRILEEGGYASVYVPPCCDDTGQALGALLDTIVMELGERPVVDLPFVGRGTNSHNGHEAQITEIVRDLMDGKVILWHAGRSEIGPRALGHRSLLADPSTSHMKTLVSETLKKREFYRPVAPLVMAEHASDWFNITTPSPYMNFAASTTALCRKTAPAVVHVDGSARVQTIAADGDPTLRSLLTQFYERTGIPLLINTSLNGPNQPICDTVADSVQWLGQIRELGFGDKVSLVVNGCRQDI